MERFITFFQNTPPLAVLILNLLLFKLILVHFRVDLFPIVIESEGKEEDGGALDEAEHNKKYIHVSEDLYFL